MQTRGNTAMLAAAGASSALLVIMGIVVALGLIAMFIGGRSRGDAKRSRRTARG
ncbi:hypothetical protein [Streptomyces sp. NPDC050264]|uniref:hypothetical protein n=1 Tax=Streptomyces sp. NPDC050264 TaxID=3155038 RepID=UPI00342855AC